MKGLKRLLFAAVMVSLAVTMVLAAPGSWAQTPHVDTSITKVMDNPPVNPVDKYDRDRRDVPAPKITYKQAEEIALRATDGGYVEDIDLEYKGRYGRLIYEVEVKKGYDEFDVDIDAETGEVLRVKRD